MSENGEKVSGSKRWNQSAKVGDGTPGPGRKKGVPNKASTEFRETVTRLLEKNSDNVGIWLGKVADEDPAKALDLLAKLAEFAAPKLSRAEVTGKDGAAFQLIVGRSKPREG